MTLVFSQPTEQSPLHVLIVGVGWYGHRDRGVPVEDSPQLAELPGVVRSAERAAKWWQEADADDRLINCNLGSLDVLLSTRSEQVSLRGINSEPIEPCTVMNVRAAVDRWARAGAATEGSIAVLHWIGHGQNEFGDREWMTRAITLFCEDSRDDGRGTLQPLAISLSETLEDLRRIPFASRSVVFVDACRSKVARDDKFKYPSALSVSLSRDAIVTKNDITCYSLMRKDLEALCRPPPDPVDKSGFKGGAMVTEAVLDTLSSYGGESMPGSEPGRIISASAIGDTATARLEWWASHLRSRRLRVAADSDDLFPLVRVRRPRTMIRAKVRPRQRSQTNDEPILRRRLDEYCTHGAADVIEALIKVGDDWLVDVESGLWCAYPTSADADWPHDLVDAELGHLKLVWTF